MPSLILGSIIFQNFEIPERINFGGVQRIRRHHVMGGDDVLDAMGPSPDPIRWHGIFKGPDAISRARTLDAMRQSGAQTVVSWLGLAYPVIVASFQAVTERFYEVPYEICLEVITETSTGFATSSLDTLITGDLALASLAVS